MAVISTAANLSNLGDGAMAVAVKSVPRLRLLDMRNMATGQSCS